MNEPPVQQNAVQTDPRDTASERDQTPSTQCSFVFRKFSQQARLISADTPLNGACPKRLGSDWKGTGGDFLEQRKWALSTGGIGCLGACIGQNSLNLT